LLQVDEKIVFNDENGFLGGSWNARGVTYIGDKLLSDA